MSLMMKECNVPCSEILAVTAQGGQHDRHEGMMGFVGKIIGNPRKIR